VTLPPLLIWLRIREPGSRGIRIWLPVVLLWPLIFPLAVAALAACAILDLSLWMGRAAYHQYSLLLISLFRLLAEIRGTRVRVCEEGATRVDIVVI